MHSAIRHALLLVEIGVVGNLDRKSLAKFVHAKFYHYTIYKLITAVACLMLLLFKLAV